MAVAARESAGEQVVLNREMGEAMAAFHHLNAAAPYQLARRARVHLFTVEDDGALGHFTALGRQQVRDGLERGGFAGAVCAEERHDVALPPLTRPPLERRVNWVVADLGVVPKKNGGGRRWGRHGMVLRARGS